MAANNNPTVAGRRLGAELRRFRRNSGMTGTQVAERLLISQAKVSHMETGRRAVSPRDVRDLCMLYGVTDQHAVDSLTALARSRADRAGGTPTATSPTAPTSTWRRSPPPSAPTNPW